MELLAYSEKNRTTVAPWILDPEHEGLDLENEDCGCGCSCSCSCSRDDTGTNDGGDNLSDSDDSCAAPEEETEKTSHFGLSVAEVALQTLCLTAGGALSTAATAATTVAVTAATANPLAGTAAGAGVALSTTTAVASGCTAIDLDGDGK